MEQWKPSLVVGIDFGMTCTAVSYSKAPEWSEPRIIQKWPQPRNEDPGKLANKVKTIVGYDDDGNLINWGFETCYDGKRVVPEDCFKLFLDPAVPHNHVTAPTHAQATTFYTDYMKSLLQYIEQFFNNATIDFYERNVEFLFSIPTTWRNPKVSDNLEKILARSGFAGHNRRVKIYLTEAEAAAVNAAKESYGKGDIIMVADAGGATTDINIMEVLERTERNTRLKALTKAEGIYVGSTLIDERIKKLIIARLRTLGVDGSESDLAWAAEDMLREKPFEAIKCVFDGHQHQIEERHMFSLPGDVAPHLNSRRVAVTGQEIKDAFNSQIQVMAEKINQQITELLHEHPQCLVQYLILSGGLGSSRYVLNQLRARFTSLKIFCINEAQLAVAKGLVMDRVQKLKGGIGIYTGKCSRVSYGVLCRQLYDPVLHRGENVDIDPLDRKKWAIEQIDWLIRESEPVKDNVYREYQIKFPKGDTKRTFDAQFVMSEVPARELPQSLSRGRVQRLCVVRAVFKDDGQLIRKPGFLLGRQSHVIADFKLKVITETTSLKFEITSTTGTPFHQNDASIEVQWQEVTETIEPPPLRDPRGFYPKP